MRRAVGTTLGPNATATLTIQDNDAPGTFQFGAATYSVVEGGTSPVMITRTGGSGGTVVLQWAATGGSATGGALPTTPGADYAPTSGLLTFGPAVTSQRVPLTIVNDTVAEDPETVALGITGIVSSSAGAASIGAQSSTTLTIAGQRHRRNHRVHDHRRQRGRERRRRQGHADGEAEQAPVPRFRSPAGFSWTTRSPRRHRGPGDFTLPGATLTFAAGQTSVPIQITIVNDAVPEANKTVVDHAEQPALDRVSPPASTSRCSGRRPPPR